MSAAPNLSVDLIKKSYVGAITCQIFEPILTWRANVFVQTALRKVKQNKSLKCVRRNQHNETQIK